MSPDINRLAVMMYVRFPLSLRQVEGLLHERGIDICHETVRVRFQFHNHFNQERHLYSRKNFKLDRSAALAEWRELSAA